MGTSVCETIILYSFCFPVKHLLTKIYAFTSHFRFGIKILTLFSTDDDADDAVGVCVMWFFCCYTATHTFSRTVLLFIKSSIYFSILFQYLSQINSHPLLLIPFFELGFPASKKCLAHISVLQLLITYKHHTSLHLTNIQLVLVLLFSITQYYFLLSTLLLLPSICDTKHTQPLTFKLLR